MSPYFAKCLSKKPDKLENAFLVATLVGEALLVEYVYKSCVVSNNGREN